MVDALYLVVLVERVHVGKLVQLSHRIDRLLSIFVRKSDYVSDDIIQEFSRNASCRKKKVIWPPPTNSSIPHILESESTFGGVMEVD